MSESDSTSCITRLGLGRDGGKFSGGHNAGGNHCCCFTSGAASALHSPQPLICGGSCVYAGRTAGALQKRTFLLVHAAVHVEGQELRWNCLLFSLMSLTWRLFFFSQPVYYSRTFSGLLTQKKHVSQSHGSNLMYSDTWAWRWRLAGVHSPHQKVGEKKKVIRPGSDLVAARNSFPKLLPIDWDFNNVTTISRVCGE